MAEEFFITDYLLSKELRNEERDIFYSNRGNHYKKSVYKSEQPLNFNHRNVEPIKDNNERHAKKGVRTAY